jgi:hypothetical protein
MKKKWEKLKLKLNFQPTQYWKNKFNKYNFKEKTCGENTVVIHSIIFLTKKSYKANLSTSSIYIKKKPTKAI